MIKKYLLWFSAGVTSAIACYMAIMQYGPENCIVYYIDIASAHPDNDRFIKDCEKLFGLRIHRVGNPKYEDQFDVIRQRRFINGPHGALCTTELKKNVRLKIQSFHPDHIQIFGFDFSVKEINRAIRFIEQYPDVNPRFPLIENSITKAGAMDLLLKLGIDIPAMYKLGYSNNNCIGCTKGGKGYWNKIRIDFPDVYDEMADAEREVGRTCIKGVFLDELDPEDGRTLKPVLPDCGSFCEIKYTDILDKRATLIYEDPSFLKVMYG